MGLFSNIIGGGTGTSAQQAMATGATTYASLAAQQHAATSGTILMSTGTSTNTWSSLGATTNHSLIISVIQQYCHMIGWEFSHLYIPNMESNDPKVAILKLAKENEVIKDVGVRIGDHNFYIMREPKDNEY